MPSIDTLIRDVYAVVEDGHGEVFSEYVRRELSESISNGLGSLLGEDRSRSKATLRLSGMGPRCPSALWYSIHEPTRAEPLPPWARVKFSFGTIVESFAIALCRAAGHEVTGEQDELWVDGIAGHRDAVVDGCIVDFKSCSSRAFQKFKDKSISQNDSFGYLEQMDGYLVGSLNDPLVRVKDRGYFFAVDKTLGHMCLYEHIIREESIRSRIKESKRIVALDSPPPCRCRSVPDGASGNLKLDVRAAYEPFKYCCNPSIRTFIYSDGPRYLTKVVREPNVPELKRQHRYPQLSNIHPH